MPETLELAKLQFRVLYREFLFRMVDLELLSAHAQGDISRLLGQFASLLIFVSIIFAAGAFGIDGRMPPQARLTLTWTGEHSLIATTMLVVGLFAVVSWESTFPDRRDVLVLAPLPIRARTLFLAKVAALATALSVTVAAFNGLPGLTWPLALAAPTRGGLLGLMLSLAFLRSLAAYWITMLGAGAFIFCSVLCVQGLAAQLLSRRQFLRVSSLLQMAAFCLFVSVYFLEPSLTTPKALTTPENQRMLAWLPSYWFLGLFQTLNGSGHPALAPLARRAWIGFPAAVLGSGAMFLLSYFRTLKKIVEEPDIVPGARSLHWLPRFGNSLETAVVQFSIRTLLRSRQHRVTLAFYLGIGFAIVVLLVKPMLLHQKIVSDQARALLMVSSVLMMCFAVVGTRVVFSLPLAIRANWIFRITEVRGAPAYLAAIRRPLFVLGVGPVWAASAALFLSIWPWRLAAGHLIVLGLWGMILAYIWLHEFQKIPFTCSYLPGKSYFHMAFLGSIGMLWLIVLGVAREQRALRDPVDFARVLFVLGIAVVCARWRTVRLAKSEEAAVQFEEPPPDEIFVLGLYRDGTLPIKPAK